jgi:hypothetical protein
MISQFYNGFKAAKNNWYNLNRMLNGQENGNTGKRTFNNKGNE